MKISPRTNPLHRSAGLGSLESVPTLGPECFFKQRRFFFSEFNNGTSFIITSLKTVRSGSLNHANTLRYLGSSQRESS
jgi:hypothetical protein